MDTGLVHPSDMLRAVVIFDPVDKLSPGCSGAGSLTWSRRGVTAGDRPTSASSVGKRQCSSRAATASTAVDTLPQSTTSGCQQAAPPLGRVLGQLYIEKRETPPPKVPNRQRTTRKGQRLLQSANVPDGPSAPTSPLDPLRSKSGPAVAANSLRCSSRSLGAIAASRAAEEPWRGKGCFSVEGTGGEQLPAFMKSGSVHSWGLLLMPPCATEDATPSCLSSKNPVTFMWHSRPCACNERARVKMHFFREPIRRGTRGFAPA